MKDKDIAGEKENIEELIKNLEECQKLRDEYLTGWQKAMADFLNYKKEEMGRVGDFLKYANAGFVLKILPILDNFELAEKILPENFKNDENVKGLLMVKNQIQDFLKSQKVEEIKSVGEKFDPNSHEIIGEVGLSEDSAQEDKSGTIIEEIQKGYTINGRLLRPAKVKITK
ncbi:MAG: nucleotide exchange factor GrpE [Patescibacteria group bacterium]